MYQVQTWGGAVYSSLLELWIKFATFIPYLIGAILVLLLGFVVAGILGKIVSRLVGVTRIDRALEKLTEGEILGLGGIRINLATFFGELVRWFLILVFVMAATEILQLNQVADFLNQILMYLPKVIVAAIILAIAFLAGNLVHRLVRGSVRAAGVMSASLLAVLAKWAVLIFGLLAAFIQLGIATSLVNILFTGIVAALSLAAGLAFGLGGKDEAALILRKIREEITENR